MKHKLRIKGNHARWGNSVWESPFTLWYVRCACGWEPRNKVMYPNGQEWYGLPSHHVALVAGRQHQERAGECS